MKSKCSKCFSRKLRHALGWCLLAGPIGALVVYVAILDWKFLLFAVASISLFITVMYFGLWLIEGDET